MAEGRALRRIGDPVVAAAPAGVRIRTRIHPTAAEAEALTAIGELLGSLYRGELAGRVRLGRLDRTAQAVWRAQHKRALTAVSSSRWAGAITRAVEDQYQLGMRGVAAQVADLRAAVEVLEAAVCAASRRARAGRGTPRPAVGRGAGVVGIAARRNGSSRPAGWRCCGPVGHRRGGVGRGSAVDHGGWETVVAQPQPPRRRRHDRAAMARASGMRRGCF